MTAPEEQGLVLQGVTVAAAGRPLFPPLDIAIGGGEVATVMGPSGSGKSSLLAWLCGALDPPARQKPLRRGEGPGLEACGRVLLDGADVTALPPERRRIGILFQDDLLFPHMSVAGNLGFALPPGLARAERAARIGAALEEVELAGFGDRDPATLSGGQRARIALMRTLLAAPRALLLDEPFAKLDAALKDRFRAFVFEHVRMRHIPVLLATHEPADAEAAGGPLVELRS